MLRRRGARAASVLIGGVFILVASPALTPVAHADEFYYPYGNWNGKKIYLSPARHSDAGGRGECQGQNENAMAFRTARSATQGDWYGDYTYDRYDPGGTGRSLRSRGYQVAYWDGHH